MLRKSKHPLSFVRSRSFEDSVIFAFEFNANGRRWIVLVDDDSFDRWRVGRWLDNHALFGGRRKRGRVSIKPDEIPPCRRSCDRFAIDRADSNRFEPIRADPSRSDVSATREPLDPPLTSLSDRKSINPRSRCFKTTTAIVNSRSSMHRLIAGSHARARCIRNIN